MQEGWGSVPEDLAPPPILARILPTEAATAENLLSNDLGENTQRLSARLSRRGGALPPERMRDLSKGAVTVLTPLCLHLTAAPGLQPYQCQGHL